jgi:hypothetical protein
MKTIKESDKLSLIECKKMLNIDGKNYSDAEILKIRNWLYRYTEISLTFLEKKTNDELTDLKNLFTKK